jgi:hypothetical protein
MNCSKFTRQETCFRLLFLFILVQSSIITQKKPVGLSCVYESAPGLSNSTDKYEENYLSTNTVRRRQCTRPRSTYHFRSNNINNEYDDISYDVDRPTTPCRTLSRLSSKVYLQVALQGKREEQVTCPVDVKQLVTRFEQPIANSLVCRARSVPITDQWTERSKAIVSTHDDKRTYTLSNTDDDDDDDDDDRVHTIIDEQQTPRINIGITLDSRLRKTPVLDMLRSTAMESTIMNSLPLKRTDSFRPSSLSIARF